MNRIFKSIDSYNISPFLTKKEWTFVSSSYDSEGIQIDNLTSDDYLYKTIENLYYNTSSYPYHIYETKDLLLNELESSIISIGIPNIIYGEKIEPGTLNLSYTSESVLIELSDDSNGNILNGSTNVGNIFYEHGNIVLNNSTINQYSNWDTDSSFELNFKGNHTIYEHEISCLINKNEFNLTLNRTAYSGSVGISDIYNYSDDWTPYITSIGLYDNNYELIAVGKLARPVKNINDMNLTFVVKFDL